MRIIFGMLSLLIALLIVGSLVKKQSQVLNVPVQLHNAPAELTTAPAQMTTAPALNSPQQPAGHASEQSRQIQQQIKQAVDAQMQARPMPDDSK